MLSRLLQQPGDFETLLQRVQRIETLDRAVHQWIVEPWLSAIRVANLRGDTLVVFSESAAAATMLRYRRDDLMSYLRQRHGLVVSRIETKVRPGAARRRV
ncbi:hypothetical protein B1810_16325 [Panacagrimonas perspica]|nr:hypothetical protein B1810_16325 [Panacagrimonas perspica]